MPAMHLTRALPLLAIALLAACSIPAGREDQRAPAPAPRSQGAPVASTPGARQCLADLARDGASFTPLPDRYTGQGCTNLNTVQLNALSADNGTVAVANLGPVTCGVTDVFAGWARYGVDRAARQILGSPLRSIETFGSYSCRNVAGTGKRSAHATADAIDVSAFVLENGQRIVVKEDWNGGTGAERQFLRVVHDSACKRFDTILGPEYNSAHQDHFHLEGVIGGKSYCR